MKKIFTLIRILIILFICFPFLSCDTREVHLSYKPEKVKANVTLYLTYKEIASPHTPHMVTVIVKPGDDYGYIPPPNPPVPEKSYCESAAIEVSSGGTSVPRPLDPAVPNQPVDLPNGGGRIYVTIDQIEGDISSNSRVACSQAAHQTTRYIHAINMRD